MSDSLVVEGGLSFVISLLGFFRIDRSGRIFCSRKIIPEQKTAI